MPKNARAVRTMSTAVVRAVAPRSVSRAASRTSTLRIERRGEMREAATGALSATYSGEGRHGITHLELVDRSPSGLGAVTRTHIEPGMIVTICPEGSRIPWLSARVARCTAEGDMYRLGLAFDRRTAA
jgi:hypothetical protein